MDVKITGGVMTVITLLFQAMGDWGTFYELLEKGGLVAILGFFCYVFYRMGQEDKKHYERKLEETRAELKLVNEEYRSELKRLLQEEIKNDSPKE